MLGLDMEPSEPPAEAELAGHVNVERLVAATGVARPSPDVSGGGVRGSGIRDSYGGGGVGGGAGGGSGGKGHLRDPYAGQGETVRYMDTGTVSGALNALSRAELPKGRFVEELVEAPDDEEQEGGAGARGGLLARLAGQPLGRKAKKKRKPKYRPKPIHVNPAVLQALLAVQEELNSAQAAFEASIDASGRQAERSVVEGWRREGRQGWGHMRMLALLTTDRELAEAVSAQSEGAALSEEMRQRLRVQGFGEFEQLQGDEFDQLSSDDDSDYSEGDSEWEELDDVEEFVLSRAVRTIERAWLRYKGIDPKARPSHRRLIDTTDDEDEAEQDADGCQGEVDEDGRPKKAKAKQSKKKKKQLLRRTHDGEAAAKAEESAPPQQHAHGDATSVAAGTAGATLGNAVFGGGVNGAAGQRRAGGAIDFAGLLAGIMAGGGGSSTDVGGMGISGLTLSRQASAKSRSLSRQQTQKSSVLTQAMVGQVELDADFEGARGAEGRHSCSPKRGPKPPAGTGSGSPRPAGRDRGGPQPAGQSRISAFARQVVNYAEGESTMMVSSFAGAPSPRHATEGLAGGEIKDHGLSVDALLASRQVAGMLDGGGGGGGAHRGGLLATGTTRWTGSSDDGNGDGNGGSSQRVVTSVPAAELDLSIGVIKANGTKPHTPAKRPTPRPRPQAQPVAAATGDKELAADVGNRGGLLIQRMARTSGQEEAPVSTPRGAAAAAPSTLRQPIATLAIAGGDAIELAIGSPRSARPSPPVGIGAVRPPALLRSSGLQGGSHRVSSYSGGGSDIDDGDDDLNEAELWDAPLSAGATVLVSEGKYVPRPAGLGVNEPARAARVPRWSPGSCAEAGAPPGDMLVPVLPLRPPSHSDQQELQAQQHQGQPTTRSSLSGAALTSRSHRTPRNTAREMIERLCGGGGDDGRDLPLGSGGPHSDPMASALVAPARGATTNGGSLRMMAVTGGARASSSSGGDNVPSLALARQSSPGWLVSQPGVTPEAWSDNTASAGGGVGPAALLLPRSQLRLPGAATAAARRVTGSDGSGAAGEGSVREALAGTLLKKADEAARSPLASPRIAALARGRLGRVSLCGGPPAGGSPKLPAMRVSISGGCGHPPGGSAAVDAAMHTPMLSGLRSHSGRGATDSCVALSSPTSNPESPMHELGSLREHRSMSGRFWTSGRLNNDLPGEERTCSGGGGGAAGSALRGRLSMTGGGSRRSPEPKTDSGGLCGIRPKSKGMDHVPDVNAVAASETLHLPPITM